MASQAGSRRQADVAERCIRPDCGFMATVALRCGENMVSRLERCSVAVTRTVAGRAIAWRSLENTLDMAGFALHQDMRASQVEPGFDVVEFLCRVFLYVRVGFARLRHSKVRRKHKRKYQDQPDPYG